MGQIGGSLLGVRKHSYQQKFPFLAGWQFSALYRFIMEFPRAERVPVATLFPFGFSFAPPFS